MNCNVINDFDEFRETGNAGAVCFLGVDDVQGLAIKCPGCGRESYLPTDGGPGPNWNFDKNREKPTLKPSVYSKGCCGWHGYLTAGEWKEC